MTPARTLHRTTGAYREPIRRTDARIGSTISVEDERPVRMLKRYVAIGGAALALALGGGGVAAAATPAGPGESASGRAAAAGCTPKLQEDWPGGLGKTQHVWITGCGDVSGAPAKLILDYGGETDCKPLDGNNHASWGIPAGAGVERFTWCPR